MCMTNERVVFGSSPQDDDRVRTMEWVKELKHELAALEQKLNSIGAHPAEFAKINLLLDVWPFEYLQKRERWPGCCHNRCGSREPERG